MLAAARDPIVAVATAPGRGAVGIVRVSGPGLALLARALTGKALAPRVATYGPLLASDGSAIDQGLTLHFPAPHSYTGEDVLELQAHGGPVVLQLLVARCLEAAAAPHADTGEPTLPRLRLAEPGEFTRRAFLNGKLDLAQAEAVSDLIEAGTEAAVRSAARSLQGEFSTRVNAQAKALLKLRLLVEATLDFPEEEIDFLQAADARGQLAALIGGVQAVQQQARQGALLRDGLQVVIAGQPNVGKSSLLNALAGAELAIVTPIAGTTRDRIEQAIQIEGVPLHIVDTAGLRDEAEAADEVERIGMQRTWEAVRRADVVLFLHDLTRVDDPAHQARDTSIAAALARHGIEPVDILHVHNKRDAAMPAALQALPAGALALSARAGDGLDALRQALLQRAGWQALPEGVFMARERHLRALADTLGHLSAAQAQLTGPEPALDLLAEELRLAHTALGSITGQVSADDLLGEIFGRFCIGK